MLIFFNLGGGEVFLVILAIILLFGSKKIPELARGLGKGIREFKDATNSIQREIHKTTHEIREDIENPENKFPEGLDGREGTDEGPVKPQSPDGTFPQQKEPRK